MQIQNAVMSNDQQWLIESICKRNTTRNKKYGTPVFKLTLGILIDRFGRLV
jgi:hypothetical protein